MPATPAKRRLYLLLLVFSFLASRAADEPFRIDYTVDVANMEEHLFHVAAEVKNIRQDSVELSLPVWTPGWYTLENYARNISRFIVRGPDGARLNHERTARKQSCTARRNERDLRASKLNLTTTPRNSR